MSEGPTTTFVPVTLREPPPQVPSYWLVYFTVADVDKSFKTATQAGARELVAPMEFPGGRFAILTDPQGASFGLLKMAPR